MIRARPHINGNTREHFESAARSLIVAKSVLKTTLVDVSMNVTHGRNYQHLSAIDGRDAQEDDVIRLAPLRSALTEIDNLILDLRAAAKGAD